MANLKTTVKNIIVQKTMKNLLIAQKRLADEGSGSDLIRVTKYLLWLSQKFGDVLVDVVPECDKQRCGGPVNDLGDFTDDAASI